MIKIAIIAAGGQEGRCLQEEALRRGHQVTAVVRDRSRLQSTTGLAAVLEKDLFELEQADLLPFDAVLDAFGAWTPETLPLHEKQARHLGRLLSGTGVRLLVVGGAGSLFTDESRSLLVVDSPDFPEEFRSLARACRKAYEALASFDELDWTYLCPPAEFYPNGPRTGRYRAGTDVLLVGADATSSISYADYAVAMLDEVEKKTHPQQLFTVVNA